eukprot:603766-Rhodomonas_salina.2
MPSARLGDARLPADHTPRRWHPPFCHDLPKSLHSGGHSSYRVLKVASRLRCDFGLRDWHTAFQSGINMKSPVHGS